MTRAISDGVGRRRRPRRRRPGRVGDSDEAVKILDTSLGCPTPIINPRPSDDLLGWTAHVRSRRRLGVPRYTSYASPSVLATTTV
jgi:hypothetical protein